MQLRQIERLLGTTGADALTRLFTELGWDHAANIQIAPISGVDVLHPIAQKRGYQVIGVHTADLPDKANRDRIERAIQKQIPNKLLIYSAGSQRVWQFSTRDSQRRRTTREFAEPQDRVQLAQFLARMEFGLDQEESLTLVDVLQTVNPLAEVERVTKRFYEEFKRQHDAFMAFIDGIPDEQIKRWYASVMLNRLMFIYFLQKKQFVAGDVDYLKNKLASHPDEYYQGFLCPLFFDGFAKKPAERSPESTKKLGNVPYLNGGIFSKHQIEQAHGQTITIADEAFRKIFAFFDGWTWHLDDRALRPNSNEINPDVLGYIFEKYINQRQMGAYYTKEDITEYICRSTIVPFLLDLIVTDADWRMLAADPERYIFAAVRHGLEEPLPDAIAAGVADVSARGGWNVAAPASHALPTEIWRETVARRQRATQLIERMRNGALRQSNDLITENLDVRLFLADVIAHADVTRVVTLWQRLQTLSVLDPTVGSGAFLFAALNILMPVYDACIDRLGVLRSDDALAPHTQVVAAVLHDLQAHKSQTYTVLKRIMVNNLYGVDIMEEAVEICKLRLFLKLTAQISELAQLEPLPDIDFNIRAGNTLVGYARLKDANNIVLNTTKQMDLNDTEDELKKQLEALSAIVAEYRAAATQQGTTYEEKEKLSAQFSATAEVLNLRLAELYKIDVKDAHSYEAWKKSHEPFHWCSEFYEIVEERGGFDVVVGNPPYVAKRKVDYRIDLGGDFKCSDLYGYVMKRGLSLASSESWYGMIVMHSLLFSSSFKDLRQAMYSDTTTSWFSAFSRIPAGLFSGDVRVRNAIVVSKLSSKGTQKSFYTTRMHRWFGEQRNELMSLVSYATYKNRKNIPCNSLQNLIDLYETKNLPLVLEQTVNQSHHQLFFKQSAYNWLAISLQPAPVLNENGELVSPTMVGQISFKSPELQRFMLLLLNGKFAYSIWATYGDDFHVTRDDLLQIPYCAAITSEDKQLLHRLADDFTDRLDSCIQYKLNAGKKVGTYNTSKLWGITDQSDRIFLKYLTTEVDQIMDDIQRHVNQVVLTGQGQPEEIDDGDE